MSFRLVGEGRDRVSRRPVPSLRQKETRLIVAADALSGEPPAVANIVETTTAVEVMRGVPTFSTRRPSRFVVDLSCCDLFGVEVGSAVVGVGTTPARCSPESASTIPR